MSLDDGGEKIVGLYGIEGRRGTSLARRWTLLNLLLNLIKILEVQRSST